jgi:hypothetical protein
LGAKNDNQTVGNVRSRKRSHSRSQTNDIEHCRVNDVPPNKSPEGILSIVGEPVLEVC